MTSWNRMNLLWPTLLVLLLVGSAFSAFGSDAQPPLLDDDPRDEATGRAGGEIALSAVLEPRPSTGDGYTVRTVQAGDDVNFRLAVTNLGDTVQSDVSVDVQVNIADEQGDPIEGQIAIQRSGDVAVDPLDSGTHLAVGEYLAGGNYIVQTSAGTDLTWAPNNAGLYSVHVQLNVDNANDADFTNNEKRFVIRVVDYYDVGLNVSWNLSGVLTDEQQVAQSPEGQDGEIDFAVRVDIDSSVAESEVRNLTVEVCVLGDAAVTANSTVDGGALVGDCVDIEIGTMDTVPTFTNLSDPADPRNINESRRIASVGDTFTIDGTAAIDVAASGGFTVTAQVSSMATLDVHEECAEPPWWDPGPDGQPGIAGVDDDDDDPEEIDEDDELGWEGSDDIEQFAIILCEQEIGLDDRPSNDYDYVSGFSSTFNDIGIEGGIQVIPENGGGSRVNVGETLLVVTVGNFGSTPASNAKDWNVEWTLRDGAGTVLNTTSTNDCDNQLYEVERGQRYTHTLVPQPAGEPFAYACLELDMPASRLDVTATAMMLGQDPDQNPANDIATGIFDGINDVPFGEIEVRANEPVIVGDSIVLDATRVTDTETTQNELSFVWSRQSAEVTEELGSCTGPGAVNCPVIIDDSWVGVTNIFAQVTDSHGGIGISSSGEVQFRTSVTVYGEYSSEVVDAGDGVSALYTITQKEPLPLTPTIVTATPFTAQTLGQSSATYDSIVAFQFTLEQQLSITDILSETLTVTYPDTTSNEEALSLWYSNDGNTWFDLAASGTMVRDAGANSLSWTAESGTLNKQSGYFAVFAATSAPPAIGIATLTATPQPGGSIVLDWTTAGVAAPDEDFIQVNISSTSMAEAQAGGGQTYTLNTNQTSYTMAGLTHGTTYHITVAVKNGNGWNASHGEASATSDARVDPAPTVTSFTVTETTTQLTIAWTASDAGDVAQWRVCWAGQEIQGNLFADAQSCSTTADETVTSVTVDKPGTSMFHFALGGVDALGNVGGFDGDTSQRTSIDLTEDVVIDSNTGVEGGGDEESGEIPSWAWIAIGAVVVGAVIIGALIFVRGGGDSGGGSDWDY